jgi:undecaprenyl-diphosphatase
LALTQLVVFAVLQGLTAIFPIGATTHFDLLHDVFGWPNASPLLVIAARTGVLLAIAAYFWRDLFDMVMGVVRAAKGKRDANARLALQLVVASIPTLVLGFFAERSLGEGAYPLAVVGWVTLGGAILLLFFDRMSMTVKRVEHATFLDMLLVGLSQVISLIPGVSRAGITMTMARFLGYERAEAVRFSMLLAIPVFLALVIRDAIAAGSGFVSGFTRADIFGGALSFMVALFALTTLMTWLHRSTFTPFMVYRLVLGATVVALAYGGVHLKIPGF